MRRPRLSITGLAANHQNMRGLPTEFRASLQFNLSASMKPLKCPACPHGPPAWGCGSGLAGMEWKVEEEVRMDGLLQFFGFLIRDALT